MAIQYATNSATAPVGAAGAAASISAPAVAGRSYFLMGIAASYDTSAGVGELTISAGATAVFRYMVHGNEIIPFPAPVIIPEGVAVTITLAGASSRVARLSAWYAPRG